MRCNSPATLLRGARLCALLALALAALLVPAADAQAATGDPGWAAAYWNNTALSGDPIFTRQEATLDNRWGAGSPDGSINDDFFSARWMRTLALSGGVYRFTAVTDDGMRVWIDDRLILDQWREQAARTFVVDRRLSAGQHTVRVEYFEATGDATAILNWERLSGGGQPAPAAAEWRAEFFNNRDLAGDPALLRNDSSVSFDWGGGSPAPGQVNADNFSVRWTRDVNLDAGNYRFTVVVDDGVRLWVNNARILDEWREQSPRTFSADIYLPGGAVPIRLEFLEIGGNALVRLDWQRLDQSPPPANGGGDNNADDAWRGEYYDNGNFDGSPTFVRHDGDINFDWGYGAPHNDMDPDWFTVRWTRTIFTGEGRHRFSTETDDGVRLWVDGRRIIDEWQAQARTRRSASIDLDRGTHTVVVEYQERTQLAFAKVTISGPTVDSRPPVGNIVTCAPPRPDNNAWIKLYRLDGNNNWNSISRGIGSVSASGFLKIDGLPVDANRFGDRGEPYKVELWVDGRVVTSTGDFQRGEPEFRVRAFADNYTPWQCGQ